MRNFLTLDTQMWAAQQGTDKMQISDPSFEFLWYERSASLLEARAAIRCTFQEIGDFGIVKEVLIELVRVDVATKMSLRRCKKILSRAAWSQILEYYEEDPDLSNIFTEDGQSQTRSSLSAQQERELLEELRQIESGT